MSRRSDRFWRGMMAVCAVIAVACISVMLYILAAQRRTASVLKAAASDPLRVERVENTAAEPEAVDSTGVTPQEPGKRVQPTSEKVTVPIDFAYLQGINPDVYAWIVMPLSGQEYPILQNSEDDGTYLRRDIYGQYAAGGSLFTEAHHNTRSFDDPCTVVYGHNMSSGAMFGSLERSLQTMDLDDEEDERNYLTVYTPTAIRKYRIVCAGPYNSDNILYHHSFAQSEGLEEFLRDFAGYPEGGYVHCADRTPDCEDRILILSTCYRRSYQNRYLVMAVLTEQHGA